MLFDGTDDYVNVSNIGFSLMGSGISSTVCLWTKLDTVNPGKNMVIFEQSDGSSKRYVIWFHNPTASLNFYPNGFNHRSTTISANTWYFIVAVVDGSKSRMFINNIEIGSETSYTPQNTNANLQLGLGPVFGGEAWDGSLANTQIYNRALSQTEITQNFNAFKGRYGVA
jgi:hypothetical protein